MRLNKKLDQWHRAGLIDAETLESIEAFERSSSKPVALWAAGGLGAFAIVIGVVSVVAANWLFIDDGIKLGIAVALCTALAIAIYRVAAREPTPDGAGLWLRDTLIILLYGFVLASMALVGQTYQLDGSAGGLLLFWTLVTLPVVLLARGRFVAVLWSLATGLTYALNVPELHEFATRTLGFSKTNADSLAMCFLLLGPLVFIYLSRLPWLVKNRPNFSNALSICSWLVIIVGGFFAQFLWYQSFLASEIPTTVFVVTGIATAITVLLIPRIYLQVSPSTHKAMQVILAMVYLLGVSACWHETPLNLVGALTNVAYLCLLAWAALKIQSTGLFNLMTALIGIRVLFIYFEVFGSMLQTGIGLIIGGVLTLGMTWLWFKKSTRVAEQLVQDMNPISGSGESGYE